MILRVYTDGGARGNPGPAAVGVVVKKINGDGTVEKLLSFGKKIGNTTNNSAEYQAVMEALIKISNIKYQISNIQKIEFYLDSQLVVSQLNGLFKVKDANLRTLIVSVRNLEGELNVPISYQHIPREENKEADREVNKALDI